MRLILIFTHVYTVSKCERGTFIDCNTTPDPVLLPLAIRSAIERICSPITGYDLIPAFRACDGDERYTEDMSLLKRSRVSDRNKNCSSRNSTNRLGSTVEICRNGGCDSNKSRLSTGREWRRRQATVERTRISRYSLIIVNKACCGAPDGHTSVSRCATQVVNGS